MIDGYGFRATHGRNADDRYSALPGGGAFLHRMHAVSVEWDESRTHEKVVRVMEACTARRINFLFFPIIQREEIPALIRQYI